MTNRLSKHSLLIRGAPISERVCRWTVADHLFRLAGERRGFQVRVYQGEAWPEPYLVAMVARDGMLMEAETAPTPAAADASALAMIRSLDGVSAPAGEA